MANDPLNDVRSVRRTISAECGHDPEQVFDFYRKHQEEARQSGRFHFITARMESVQASPVADRKGEREPE